MSKKSNTSEGLRAAEQALATAQSIAGRETLKAMSLANATDTNIFHPSQDYGAQMVAEAEIELAQQQTEHASKHSGIVALQSTLRAVLVATKDRLASIVDPAAPELSDYSPEGIAAHATALDTHRDALAATEAARAAACAPLLSQLQAINAAYRPIVNAADAAGLPRPSLWRESSSRVFPVLGFVPPFGILGMCALAAEGGNVTVELIDELCNSLGQAPIQAARAEQALREIAQRRASWEAKQKIKAAEREDRRLGLRS